MEVTECDALPGQPAPAEGGGDTAPDPSKRAHATEPEHLVPIRNVSADLAKFPRLGRPYHTNSALSRLKTNPSLRTGEQGQRSRGSRCHCRVGTGGEERGSACGTAPGPRSQQLGTHPAPRAEPPPPSALRRGYTDRAYLAAEPEHA